MLDDNKVINQLKLGLPKGSLEQATFMLMKRAGFNFSRSERSYFPVSDDEELVSAMIRAQEIAGYVANGVFDAGITGKDWIMENNANVVEITELKYSKQSMKPVQWVVAVPFDSEIKSVKDLQGKRIATELVETTKRYLASNDVEAEVLFSWGATEVKAPVLADAIVEVTETGRSLKANNLKIIDTILTSTPRLIANPESLQDPWKKSKIDRMALLIEGAINATSRVGLKFNLPADKIEIIKEVLPAMKNPTISSLLDEKWVALEIIVDEAKVRKLIPEIKRLGGSDIIEYPLNKVIY
ncbi:MAG: ATP phosphoribosyltransferase [Deltaproteobacteria bacterium]|nr:ATP phosphoribosyltransferase [Deltaproteobacteria bacterium]MBT4525375.1 ATP phosphoribosyltransferase [Deltaproteobacteria bacterium]